MNKKITLGIVIGVLLIATIGFTYSFFSTSITGEGQDNIVTAGTLRLVYKDGQEVKLSNAKPGDTITKTFTVSNTGTLDTTYDMIYKNLINEIEKDELVVSYTCVSYKNYVDSENKGQVSGTCDGLSSQAVPYSLTSSDNMITQDISIASAITHEYTITFTFKEINAEQNYNQDKRFSTLINITEPNVVEVPRGALKTVLLADNPVIKDDNSGLFADVADEVSESGLFRTTDLTKTEDVDGDGTGEEVLYFRGVVENNYLVFAGHCWRIVRTNESGESVKLKYGGTPIISGNIYTCPQTGTSISITVNEKNKYMYSYNDGEFDQTYFKWVHEVGKDSNAKTIVETWYTVNIEPLGTKVTQLIIDEPFCNDTSVYDEKSSSAGDSIFFGAYDRLINNNVPQYKCPNESDKYSVEKGNINKPIALLTADELSYAGNVYMYNSSNNVKKTFVYNGDDFYHLLTPFHYSMVLYPTGEKNYMYILSGGGYAYGGIIDGGANTEFSIIPVISISNNAIINDGGTGEYNNPYVIEAN